MAINYNAAAVTDKLVAAFDFANPKSFSPNTFSGSLDLYSWYVARRGNNVGNNCTIVQDTSTSKSPAGGIPARMDITGNDPHFSMYSTATWNISTAANGQTWRVSVYVKSSVPQPAGQIFIFGANSSGSASPPGGGWYGITAKDISITPEWQRYDHFITFNNADIAYIQVRLDGPDSGGAGTSVWWDGLQVEPVSVTKFNSKYNQNYSNITNLITSTNATAYSYPTYDNSGFLTFDGTNHYVDASLGTLGSVITVEMVAKLKSTSAYMPFGFSNYDVYGGAGELGFNTGASDRYGLTATQTTNLGIFNNWKHYCFVMVNDTSLSTNPYTSNKIYVNAVSQTLSQTAGTQSASNKSFTDGLVRLSGWRSDSSYKMPMDLALFKVYNKQLTDAEIAQNFNAVRGRFGL